jgi:hypothetical protein
MGIWRLDLRGAICVKLSSGRGQPAWLRPVREPPAPLPCGLPPDANALLARSVLPAAWPGKIQSSQNQKWRRLTRCESRPRWFGQVRAKHGTLPDWYVHRPMRFLDHPLESRPCCPLRQTEAQLLRNQQLCESFISEPSLSSCRRSLIERAGYPVTGPYYASKLQNLTHTTNPTFRYSRNSRPVPFAGSVDRRPERMAA